VDLLFFHSFAHLLRALLVSCHQRSPCEHTLTKQNQTVLQVDAFLSISRPCLSDSYIFFITKKNIFSCRGHYMALTMGAVLCTP
jgi:hypothetical protein